MNRRDALKTGAAALGASMIPGATANALPLMKDAESITRLKRETKSEVVGKWEKRPATPYDDYLASAEYRDKRSQCEAKLLMERWQGTNLLEPYQGEQRQHLACLLESQRLHNWTGADEKAPDQPGYKGAFRRISIALCRRIFQQVSDTGIKVVSPVLSDERVDGMLFREHPEHWLPWTCNTLGETYRGHRRQLNEGEATVQLAVDISHQIIDLCQARGLSVFPFFGLGMVEGTRMLTDGWGMGDSVKAVMPHVVIYTQYPKGW